MEHLTNTTNTYTTDFLSAS